PPKRPGARYAPSVVQNGSIFSNRRKKPGQQTAVGWAGGLVPRGSTWSCPDLVERGSLGDAGTRHAESPSFRWWLSTHRTGCAERSEATRRAAAKDSEGICGRIHAAVLRS